MKSSHLICCGRLQWRLNGESLSSSGVVGQKIKETAVTKLEKACADYWSVSLTTPSNESPTHITFSSPRFSSFVRLLCTVCVLATKWNGFIGEPYWRRFARCNATSSFSSRWVFIWFSYTTRWKCSLKSTKEKLTLDPELQLANTLTGFQDFKQWKACC